MTAVAGPPTEHKKSWIAVVDDEIDVGKALRRLLRSVGFDADTFASGPEFLAILRERVPDCLILDLQMPGMTGLDVQRYLAAAGMAFPVIVITGRDEPGLPAQALAAGAAAFLLKPLDDVELLGTLSHLLGHPVGGQLS